MATPVTHTVGKTGRQFSTTYSWYLAHGNDDLVALDQIRTVEYFNDDGTPIDEGAATIDLGTINMDATRTQTFKAAAGNGAAGHPNDHTVGRSDTDPLRVDAGKGVCVHSQLGNGQLFGRGGGNQQYIYFENLQLTNNGVNGRVFSFTTFSPLPVGKLTNMIVENQAINGQGNIIGGHFDFDNYLGIVLYDRASRYALDMNQASNTLRNVLIVAPNTVQSTGMRLINGTARVDNCGVFGGAVGFQGSFTGDHNATDDATAPGANSLTGLTSTDQFEDFSGGATRDFRPKSAAAIKTGGLSATATPKDINNRDRPTPNCAINPHEGDLAPPVGVGYTPHHPIAGVV